MFAFILLNELPDYYFCVRKKNSERGDRKHLGETGIRGDRQQQHMHPRIAG
jgi:hypothetical protein